MKLPIAVSDLDDARESNPAYPSTWAMHGKVRADSPHREPLIKAGVVTQVGRRWYFFPDRWAEFVARGGRP